MPSKAALATVAGFALMGLAAFIVLQSRQQAKLTQQEYSGLPLAAAAALVASIAVLLHSSLALSGNFKPISAVIPDRGLQTHNFRQNFMRFKHRGQVLPSVLPEDHPLAASAGSKEAAAKPVKGRT